MSIEHWHVRALAALLATLLACPARTARADGGAPGQAHFNGGRTAYQEGRFADAAREFQTAYDLDKLAPLLYNIGRSHHNQYLVAPDPMNLDAAIAAYRKYLQEAPQGRYRKETIQALGELTYIASKSRPEPAAPPTPAPTPAPQAATLPPPSPPVQLPYGYDPPAGVPNANAALPPPVLGRAPDIEPYHPPAPGRRWVTPVVVVSVIAAVGLALGLGLGLGLKSDNKGSLGKVEYPY